MSLSISPKLVKAGLVLIDPRSGAIRRIVLLQYNPDALTRSFQPQAFGESQDGGTANALRLKGPAIETLRLEAELDATDQLEAESPTAVASGLQPALAALELLVHPSSADLAAQARLAGMGMLEIAPLMQPLALFCWSSERVTPVRLTELSITEEAFDPRLNPIRAKASLSMRVLSVSDLGFAHRGGALYLTYLAARERMAKLAGSGSLSQLGLGALP